MKALDMLIYGLLLAGALNWGLVGLFDFNPVAAIFGEISAITRLLYVLVGFAAIYDIVNIKSIWKRWGVHYKEPAHV
ncbi:MAG: DUF378 domain-containing protein [Planctomycetes bacterium]|nr:DUF378 domain-containing protein [Planctomycetota bacterium]